MSAEKVLSRFAGELEFETEGELRDYLREHPGTNRQQLKVRKRREHDYSRPLFEPEPLDIDDTIPLPRPGKIPTITEEQLDVVDQRLKDTETGKARTIAPGRLKNQKVKNEIHKARQQIEKIRKFLDSDDPKSSDEIYHAIQNLHSFEEFVNGQNKMAKIVERFNEKD